MVFGADLLVASIAGKHNRPAVLTEIGLDIDHRRYRHLHCLIIRKLSREDVANRHDVTRTKDYGDERIQGVANQAPLPGFASPDVSFTAGVAEVGAAAGADVTGSVDASGCAGWTGGGADLVFARA